jgi:hydrogenase expression/formation protein HypD
MKYVDEFRNKAICENILKGIFSTARNAVTFMEVCGTHTVSLFRYGIRDLLPSKITFLSGPGCPVCVTSQGDIDRVIAAARQQNTIIATYGDMIRVPGTESSLEKERGSGREVRIVYSALDAITLAREHSESKVIFLGVGFETTAPGSAVAILEAQKEGLDNFFMLSCHKCIPPAMKLLLESGEVRIDGFLCPGHVSTILGSGDYEFIPVEYGIPCVIAGFEPVDILESVKMLIDQVNTGHALTAIQYTRSVKSEGNVQAKKVLERVFEPVDSEWRGIGVVPKSGLTLKGEFERYDAGKLFDLEQFESREPPECICGEILRGVKTPLDCPIFSTACTPHHPVGPCMVSPEGTCGTYYRYGKRANTWTEKE